MYFYIYGYFLIPVCISLDKQKGLNDLVDPNIKSGIIFHLGTPGPLGLDLNDNPINNYS
jgi:hypothetical protein